MPQPAIGREQKLQFRGPELTHVAIDQRYALFIRPKPRLEILGLKRGRGAPHQQGRLELGIASKLCAQEGQAERAGSAGEGEAGRVIGGHGASCSA